MTPLTPARASRPAPGASPTLSILLTVLPARLFLAFGAQLAATALLAAAGNAHPWEGAQASWTVWGTLVDLGTVLLLIVLLRREGKRLRDLFPTRSAGVRELPWTPLYLVGLAPFAGLAALVGAASGALPTQVAVLDLPAGPAAYSLVVWPVLWAITEQVFYLRYVLPRLASRLGSTPVAAMIVVAAWSIQHIALPFIADPTYLLERVIGALCVTGGSTLVYLLLGRRIVPSIIVHWLADSSTVVLALTLATA